MRIAVTAAGALAGYFGARLAQALHQDVTEERAGMGR
jgi:ketopantoate reductase